MRKKWSSFLILILVLSAFSTPVSAEPAAAVTYYVSSSAGNDANDGRSPAAPFASITKVNSLALQPGDQVLFSCSDVWRAQPLLLTHSGTAAAPIRFGAYPAGCADLPRLSGARPIAGWTNAGGDVYSAALSSADFPLGINQLFRGDQRLTLGRWPNLDAAPGGYAIIDTHSAGGNQIFDADLPAGDWSGAVVHLKNIRWSMLDRQVTSSGAHTLTLNTGFSCLASGWGSCKDWGYFINNSRASLDQEGEWYYNPTERRVYLVSTGGPPADVSGSVILSSEDNPADGGVMLGGAYVILENLIVEDWFNHGISAPGATPGSAFHHLTLQGLTIRDVNGIGINLTTWIYDALDGQDGFRGGDALTLRNNLIDGANSFGLTGYFTNSLFESNTIRNIGLVENLGISGMGCGFTSGECTENGDGFRIRTDNPANSGYGNILQYNIIEKTAYNGVDIFGHDNTLTANVITQACYVKADCGAVRSFGKDNLSNTSVYNLHLVDNLVLDIPGNVDGCPSSLPAFGMGLYIDNYSRDVEIRGNFIADTTAGGILYQRSSGEVRENTVFDASSGTAYSAQVELGGEGARVSLAENTFFGIKPNAWTLYTESLNNVAASDYNRFYHPYRSATLVYESYWPPHSLAEWQNHSGQDLHSQTLWYSQADGEPSRARVFANPKQEPLTIDLGDRQYLDLNQHPRSGSLYLEPFSAIILVDNGPAALSLSGLSPALVALGRPDFTLTVRGTAFTTNSVVRWSGSDRPTTWINSSTLRASISAADVSSLGDVPVTVYDLQAGETGPLWVRVVTHVYPLALPLIFNED